MCQINICLSRIYHRFHLNSFLLTSLVSKDTKLNEYIIQNFLSHWIISFVEIYTQPMHCPSVHPLFPQVFEIILVTIHHHKNWTYYKTFHKASVHAFLTLLLDGGEWTHSQGENPPDTQWTGHYMGPRANLNAFENRLITCLSWIKSQFLSHPACSLNIVKAKLSQIFTIKQIKFLK